MRNETRWKSVADDWSMLLGQRRAEDQAQAEMVQTFGDRFAFDALSALTAVLGATQVQDLVERAGRAVRRRAARWSASLVAAGGGGGSDDADGGVGGERRLSRVHRAVSVDVAVVGNRIQLFDEVGTEPTVGSFTELNEIRRISQASHRFICNFVPTACRSFY